MASRDEILADFQACTGIDDVEVAILQLEEANWSLVDAVNKAIPGSASSTEPPAAVAVPATTAETVSSDPVVAEPLFRAAGAGTSTSATTNRSTSPPVLVDDSPPPRLPRMNNPAAVSIADDFFAGPSSSYSQRTRMLEFNIQHNNRMIHLKVPDNEDLKTLKALLQNETGFPPCQQDLRGFMNPVFPMSDHRKLSELNLPKENFLHLVTPHVEENTNGETDRTDEEMESDFKLTITDLSSGKDYKLNFRPTQTVLGVKIDMSTLTTIPVSKQDWNGWPDDISDELSLAQIGIPREHHLTVRPASDSSRNMPTLGAAGPSRAGAIHDSDDDFEDAAEMMDDDEQIFLPEKSSRRLQSLLPDDFGSDDAMGAIHFAEEFGNRYGQPHPSFFPGSLDDAIRESCGQPARERKMLAVYLHHDSSVLTNVFCTQALCADSVCSFLNENFITFGWDLTHYSNKERAVNMVTKHFGSVAASTLKNMELEKLPLLLLIYKLRGSIEIFQIINGNVMLDELMSRLLAAHDTYTSQIAVEVKEEEEREARDAVKREQDIAFQMSLEADREKAAKKEKEEAERLAKELEEKRQKEKENKVKEARIRKVSARLPPEPKDEKEEGKPVSIIRFRVPSNLEAVENGEAKASDEKKTLQRRFLASDTLQVLLDYLTIEGFHYEEFKVLSSWPRRDLSQLDRSQTLQDLKLYPQETLTLEEKH